MQNLRKKLCKFGVFLCKIGKKFMQKTHKIKCAFKSNKRGFSKKIALSCILRGVVFSCFVYSILTFKHANTKVKI